MESRTGEAACGCQGHRYYDSEEALNDLRMPDTGRRCGNLGILPVRGLFVIDDKGILRQITINDLPVGRSVDETLRLVQAFQFTDKNGEGE